MADRRQVLRFGAVAVAAPALAGVAAEPVLAAPAHGGHATSLVVGHRGTAGYRPEHTLASYELAAGWGPTTWSPTWFPRGTACWSAGTNRRSAAPDAHAAGLKVIPYTFRAENQFLPADYRVGTDPNAYGRAIDEQITFLRAGLDGLFTDQSDIGVLSRSMALVPA